MMPIRGSDRHSACVHEAGHAVVGLALEYAPIEAIVVPRESGHRDDHAGYVHWIPPRMRIRSRNSYLDEIAMLLAGLAAERICLGIEYDGSGGGYGSDIQQAVDLATLMLAKLGFGAMFFHDVSTPAELDQLRRSDPGLRRRVERLLEEQLERAEQIIRERSGEMDALVSALVGNEVVPGREVVQILRKAQGDKSAA